MTRPRLAFTLIELIIILAILGLLLMFPLSRMPETNARSRVSRAKSDLRHIGMQLEAYRAEHQAYPPTEYAVALRLPPRDSGGTGGNSPQAEHDPPYRLEIYDTFSARGGRPYEYYTDGSGWMLLSAGTDGDYDLSPRSVYKFGSRATDRPFIESAYDPTNGTYSGGDIFLLLAPKDGAKASRGEFESAPGGPNEK